MRLLLSKLQSVYSTFLQKFTFVAKVTIATIFFGLISVSANASIVGDWKLAPVAGALGVGPNLGNTGWWSNSADDVTTRSCLFDDVFSFGTDNSFENQMGAETWLEGWQGAAESCGAPIAPHDGSNAATYSYDATAGTLTVVGEGAHIGLAKVTNQGEDGVATDNTIVYQVTEISDSAITLDIQYPGGYWRFKLVPVAFVAPDDVSVTFKVDMSAVETDPTGVYLAGGNFGNAGFAMTDNGSDVWAVTLDLAPDSTYPYKFRNRASTNPNDWDGFESEVGLVAAGCSTGEFNDRFVVVGDSDMVLDLVAYGSCTAEPYVAPVAPVAPDVSVTFQVDMSAVETNADGVYLAGGGFGKDGYLLTDNGSDVWSTTVEVAANTQHLYKFRNQPALGTWDGFEEVAGLISGECNAGDYNDRFVDTLEADIVLPVVAYGSCTADPFVSEEPAVSFTVSAPNAAEVKLHSSAFSNWNADLQVVAVNNGNGTWTATVDPGFATGVEYKWIVDGVEEDLSTAFRNGECADDNVAAYEDTWFNRTWDAGAGDVTGDVAGACGGGSDTGSGSDDTAGLDFGGTFGGASIETIGDETSEEVTSVYKFPIGAQDWAGFANLNNDMYPLTFSEGGSITFDASVVDGGSTDVRFRLEYLPHPDVDPAYDTASVTVSGSDVASYTVSIPSQGDNTYSSVIMYIVSQDVGVAITNAVISADTLVQRDPVNLTLTVEASGDAVRLTGPTWGWEAEGGPEALDNGDGTWTVTLVGTTSDVEYLWVVDGVRENLLDNDPFVHACTPVTDYYSYANRKWVHNTTETAVDGDVYDVCKAQIVGVSGDPSMKAGGSTSVTVSYDASDDNAALTGLGLNVHFDSSVLTYVDASGLVTTDNISAPALNLDTEDYDNDPTTDSYISSNWASVGGNFPGSLPKDLMTLNFSVAEGLESDDYTMIQFSTTSGAAGYAFNANAYTMPVSSGSWDFDEDGSADALTDGLLLLRYTFNLRGASLTAGAISSSSLLTAEEVEANVAEATNGLADIDGNGAVDALTDGLMLLRYLFNLRGDSLIAGAVKNDATRTSAADIEAYIQSLIP